MSDGFLEELGKTLSICIYTKSLPGVRLFDVDVSIVGSFYNARLNLIPEGLLAL
jgi:hypothetical protein